MGLAIISFMTIDPYLQWSHAAPGQKPGAFILVAAINNVDAVAGDHVMGRGARVFGNESEEAFPSQVFRDDNLEPAFRMPPKSFYNHVQPSPLGGQQFAKRKSVNRHHYHRRGFARLSDLGLIDAVDIS
jgi:hypothetical protein